MAQTKMWSFMIDEGASNNVNNRGTRSQHVGDISLRNSDGEGWSSTSTPALYPSVAGQLRALLSITTS